MVPTKSAAEWHTGGNSFLENLPPGVTQAPCANKAYFVLANTHNGNFGGLAGANSWCHSQLNANSWKGKATSSVSDPAKVKAFLCTASSCNSLEPNTEYFYARTQNTSVGGGSFTTNGSGRGPGDQVRWNLASRFSYSGAIWTGRNQGTNNRWPNNNSGNGCNGWTSSSSGAQGRVGFGNEPHGGAGSYGAYERWSDRYPCGFLWLSNCPTYRSCNNSYRVICYVNP